MATQSDTAELLVGGAYYGGWKRLAVSRSIEQVAGTFTLEVTDRWAGQDTARPIKPGARCELLLGGERVISGYVDTCEPSFEDQGSQLRVEGRDATGDLVDCSAIHKSGQWRGATLDAIARDLLKPFGVGVVVQADVGERFPSFSIQQGESAFECLERAARLRAVLLVSDGGGNLVITRAGSALAPVTLEEGVNILAGRASLSWKDRYSRIVVKGQARATDDYFGDQAAGPSAAGADEAIDRYRPLIVLAEDAGTPATLAMRAQWEASVRAGRGNRGTITVQGWRRPDGVLWAPNVLVSVTSTTLYLDAPMLVVGCSYRLDEAGTFTDLTICRREAFELFDSIGVSRLKAKLNHKTQREKRKKGDDWSAL